MISVICCYNKINQFQNMVHSLETQNVDYELIGIDNTKNTFNSAASALNWGGGKQAKGEILVFLHQDILFEKSFSLQMLTEAISADGKAIIGLYGASHKKQNISDSQLTSVETLDECCVAMRKDVWEALRFNEGLCDGWHLYVVEMCLRASEKNIDLLYGNFRIKHLSSGTVDEKYMSTFKKLLVAYKSHGWLATTCKSMPTNLTVYYCYYILWKMKKILLGNFPLVFSIKSALTRSGYKRNK